MDASQFSVGGTLTQRNDEASDRLIAYFSKKQSPAEKGYTANNWELPWYIFFLKRFKCSLEKFCYRKLLK